LYINVLNHQIQCADAPISSLFPHRLKRVVLPSNQKVNSRSSTSKICSSLPFDVSSLVDYIRLYFQMRVKGHVTFSLLFDSLRSSTPTLRKRISWIFIAVTRYGVEFVASCFLGVFQRKLSYADPVAGISAVSTRQTRCTSSSNCWSTIVPIRRRVTM
jgi:hypothetical protein